jgi:predicted nucleic acid-binding Zn ribbon protein
MTSKRTNDQTLKQAIDQMLKTFRLDQKLNETRLINAWETVMGKTVANRTTQIYIRNKRLFVNLNSASLREELSHSRTKIIKLLNEEAGEDVVEEIIFQ